jgi:hypothetical protein
MRELFSKENGFFVHLHRNSIGQKAQNGFRGADEKRTGDDEETKIEAEKD